MRNDREKQLNQRTLSSSINDLHEGHTIINYQLLTICILNRRVVSLKTIRDRGRDICTSQIPLKNHEHGIKEAMA